MEGRLFHCSTDEVSVVGMTGHVGVKMSIYFFFFFHKSNLYRNTVYSISTTITTSCTKMSI